MDKPSPQPRLTREEIAKREIGRTEISRGLAWVVTVVFLLTIVVVPLVQCVHEARDLQSRGTLSAVEFFQTLPSVAEAFAQTDGNLWARILSANRRLLKNVEQYEKQLEERSLLTQRLLGPVQLCLSEVVGLGNERAYVGHDKWLFYRPDVDSLTGAGFLEPAVLKRRATEGQQHTAPPQPDPRAAIFEFHEQLARRGIRLILMPTPGKAAIHPEKLAPQIDETLEPLENTSFEQFKQEMQKGGVLVFDPAPLLARRKAVAPQFLDKADAQFLRTDTHWTPEALEFVTEQLKEFIERKSLLPAQKPTDFRERSREVANLGDIAVMLHLPEDQTLFPRERVAIRQVSRPDGSAWEPDESSDVLLLGDSFANIYSLPEMNWGTAAGLAERLSFVMRRSVDRLAQNDGGAHAVRQSLFQELAHGKDRLAGKRIVIWEFAVRELALGNWKRLAMPEPAGARSPARPSIGAGEIVVHATVRSAAGAPPPGSVPYRDAITSAHLVDVEFETRSSETKEIVVRSWGMQDNRWTRAARWSPAQKLTLRLIPWETVQEKYGRFNQIELDDPDFALLDLPTYWAEELP